MARISCEMTEQTPNVHRLIDKNHPNDQDFWLLQIQTDAGLLDLEVSVEQAQAIARTLYLRFGWDGAGR